MSSCSVCKTGVTIDTSKSKKAWGRELGIDEASVRRHLKHKPVIEAFVGESETHGPDGSSFTRYSEQPWGYDDHCAFIRSRGQDPDSVTFTWGWTSSPTGGFWNKLNNVRPRAGVDLVEDLCIDPIGILTGLRKGRSRPANAAVTGDGTFGISINDIQLGQSFNGGSAATIEDFHRRIETAKQRILELRRIGRDLTTLLIVGGGDLVEGCTIYSNQSFSLDMDRKKQVESVVTLLLYAIDELSPLFANVQILAAKGNHGENRINGNYTTLSDNDDTHVFEMAKLALSRDPEYADRIEWVIADDEAGVTIKVEDRWVFATTHGNVYAKGVAGPTIGKKAQAWYKNMAMKRDPIGMADVLITHHYHHEQTCDWGACLWKQTRSQDRGSLYFEQSTGEYSTPGMLSWVTTPTSRWQDESYLY